MTDHCHGWDNPTVIKMEQTYRNPRYGEATGTFEAIAPTQEMATVAAQVHFRFLLKMCGVDTSELKAYDIPEDAPPGAPPPSPGRYN